jgi:phosphopantothenoylcysteine decarboxylase/phosphopantothenate--cysteine ligase
MLQNKKIVLGITGGIAAYKCAELVRLYVKAGAQVQVVMTPAATQFVTAETLSVLSKNKVLVDFFTADKEWNNHVQLAEWADVFVIAPLSANTLSKMVSGACDSLLLACYLSARSKLLVAPAMDLEMYQHASVKQNIKVLIERGVRVLAAESGELASGLIGEGRMPEPATILEQTRIFLSENLPLQGVKVMVNAGPTYEAIDPVRFIGNRSSGKMGVAIAEEFQKQGALVQLILGPSSVIVPAGITVTRVESSEEMFNASVSAFETCEIAVCSAAVADYKVADAASEKIKKKDQALQLNLVPTKDILAHLAASKQHRIVVGFALETTDLIKNAIEKLQKKQLDLVVANEAGAGGGVFGSEMNKITLIDKHNKTTTFELKSKQEAATDIVAAIIALRDLK